MRIRQGCQMAALSLAVILSAITISAMAQDNQGCHPPSITSGGRRTYYFVLEERVEIPCIAAGDGTLNYQWTKNGQPLDLDTNEHESRGMYMMPGVGTLVISSFHEPDQGYYQCHVSNACGISLSNRVHMILGVIEPFPVQDSPEVIHTAVGASVVLSCNPPYSVPLARIEWAVQGSGDFDEDEGNPYYMQFIESDNRITMSYTGDLYITNVHAEDEQHGRKYMCVAQNAILRVYNIGSDKELDVQSGWMLSSNRPTALMWHSDTHITVLKGRTAKMKCIFSGNPLPTTSWEREDGQFEDSRTFKGHHELTLYDVEASDSGDYTCTGQNGVGNGQVAHTFTLTVEAAPLWQSKPVDITASSGESVEFHCSAEGDPQPTVEWFINGQPIQDTPSDPRRVLYENSLEFSNLALSDSQVIQCNVSNVHGYLWADAYLFVQGTDAEDQTVV